MKTETRQYLTQVKGEEWQVRTFALIPEGWENRLAEHPLDEQVFYWCDSAEWDTLGTGEEYGGALVIGQYWLERSK